VPEGVCDNSGPLVSVMMPTFNRRRYLPESLASALHQDYRNIEVFVVNDGGESISDIVTAADDTRIRFIDRKENRGKAYSLNEAIGQARGKYVAYLDDDDIWYPHHLSTLVTALENGSEGAAYSDLYKTWCRVEEDGSRTVLAKKVEVSRDFDRFFMMYVNHVLHVSVIHRRDLLDKTGPYNESLNVMIDWDMTRRLSFFCDFKHIYEITGEFYAPVIDCDRISVRRRKDKSDYLRNIWAIRTTRPPKPWPMMKDLAVVFIPSRVDESAAKMMRGMWMWTFYPYTVYLPWTAAEHAALNSEMPNIRRITVPDGATMGQRIDAMMAECDADYVTVVPSGIEIGQMWVEGSLWPLMNTYDPRMAFELKGSSEAAWTAVMKLEHLRQARTAGKGQTLRDWLRAAGISCRRPRTDEMPFRFDDTYNLGRQAEAEGDYLGASELYQLAAGGFGNRLWMDSVTAEAMRSAGRFTEAAEIASRVNLRRPTVDSLRTEALARKKMNDVQAAVRLLEKARDILEGTHTIWS
jgi:glycosyltransferase involved in cell wall biosynthesis